MAKYVISTYNTCTGKYEEVEVSKKVYEVYKRAEWRDEKNEIRFHQHQTPFSCLIGNEDNSIENFHEFVDISQLQYEEEYFNTDEDIDRVCVVRNALRCLNESEMFLVVNLFLIGKTERELAAELRVSHQAIHKRKVRILSRLKKEIQRNYPN